MNDSKVQHFISHWSNLFSCSFCFVIKQINRCLIIIMDIHHQEHSLEQFVAKCKSVRLKISTSKSEAMVLSREREEFPLWTGGEVLTQVEEFKYFLVHEWGKQMKQELKGKALNLQVYLLSHPHLLSQALGCDQKNEIPNTSWFSFECLGSLS